MIPPVHSSGDQGEPPDGTEDGSRRDWRRAARYVGGGLGLVAVIGATVAVTALTHDSAVRENLIAYLNGRVDGYRDLMSFLDEHGLYFDPEDPFWP